MAEEERKVVIPVDGSEHSERAFNWYMKTIRQSGDKVILVNSPEVPSFVDTPYTYGVDEYSRALRDSQQKSSQILQNYTERLKKDNVSCETVTQVGSPGNVICQTVKDKEASHIVMGSRGLGTVRRTLLGSVSNFVVNHSSAPVSVVPPENR